MSRLLDAIALLARDLPPNTLATLSARLESSDPLPDRDELIRFGATPGAKEKLRALAEALPVTPEVDGRAIALALKSAAHMVSRLSRDQDVEVAWTGPSTEAAPLRRVDQVMYELIEEAEGELLLVTYAAYKAERALDALGSASDRGVEVTMIIETAEASGGRISFDGLNVLRDAAPSARIYFWPLESRARDSKGRYGALHAKCAVADRGVALISSANLTDFALELNMELGVLIRGVGVAGRIADHFDELIRRRVLMPIVEDGTGT